MKKILSFVMMLVMIVPMAVKADDHIYNIDINVYVEKNGSAYITEVWDVQADGGTEWCKPLSNLENYEVSDFYVLMDEKEMKSMEWKSGGSLKDKAGHYGINYAEGSMELCFGKSDNERHKFMLAYGVDNYVVTTEDSQVIYHVLAYDVTVDTFFADIITYYPISEDTQLFGLGYKGNSYINNGRIVLSSYDGLENQYVAVLAKFPLNTFDSNETVGRFKTFQDVYNDSENKGYEYTKYVKGGRKFIFLDLVFILLSVFVVLLIAEFIVRRVTGKSILKHEKVAKILNKIKPVWDKIFGFIKKIFNKVKNFLKELFLKLKNKIGKKK